MDVTLKQLKYLVSLADQGNFGRAAAVVNVSQPALSMQIRALEQAVGAQLVERRARDVVVTPAGREVLERARRIIDEVRELRDAARRGRGLDGRLRLGVIPTVAPYLLPLALPLLRARNPTLDFGVREGRTQVLLDELRRGALDAAVIALPSGAKDLVEVPLVEDRFMLAGSAPQIAGLSGPLRPETLDPQRLLLLEDGHCLSDQALAACALGREETRVDLSASSLSTLCRLVEEGFGLTFVPELAVRAETAAAPGMALDRFAPPEPMRLVGLVRRRVSADAGWFSELAELLARAAQDAIGHGATQFAAPGAAAGANSGPGGGTVDDGPDNPPDRAYSNPDQMERPG